MKLFTVVHISNDSTFFGFIWITKNKAARGQLATSSSHMPSEPATVISETSTSEAEEPLTKRVSLPANMELEGEGWLG